MTMHIRRATMDKLSAGYESYRAVSYLMVSSYIFIADRT